jgi:hypothetical protein
MALNTQGRCDGCSGIVRNIPRKRYSKKNLTEMHNEICPHYAKNSSPNKS